ncbi:MAG: hypothetical protein JWR26_4993 [Pedosphaera sp.]|nr:hypothetical protein [Pedosphaera sp.]
MNYQYGMAVRLGDRVEFSGAAATVVAIGPTNEYAPGFSKSEWKDILAEGFLIRFENGSLLRLDKPEESEDLKLVKH